MRLTPVPSDLLTNTCALKPPPRATSYAIMSSTGDHATEPTGSDPCVICFGSPPAASTTQTCGVPLRLLRNAMRLPSCEYTALPVLGISAIALTRAASASGRRRTIARERPERTAPGRQRERSGFIRALLFEVRLQPDSEGSNSTRAARLTSSNTPAIPPPCDPSPTGSPRSRRAPSAAPTSCSCR